MYLLPVKSNALTLYWQFKAWALTQGHCTAIKVLQSDCGGEYLSEEFNKHLADAGTTCQLTVQVEWYCRVPQLDTVWEGLCIAVHGTSPSKHVWGSSAPCNVVEELNVNACTWGNDALTGTVWESSQLDRAKALQWGCLGAWCRWVQAGCLHSRGVTSR